ncbi:MAG: carbohydrate kinase family protein [Burkholderiales bacterium]|nr:carbohydrate kinase family protein [Burkholderiales bacterium]
MPVLICGSVAYDNIMVFEGRFRDHILPDQVHILNVAFLVPEMRREYGGCAGNIAYNLKMLTAGSVDEPLVMAAVGEDADPYFERMRNLGLETRHVAVVPETFTAQAFITTDLDDNQITAFHPGAMNSSHVNHVHDAADIGLGIVAPDGREGMLMHAREFAEGGIPFLFDPGQGLPMFSGDELLDVIDRASFVAVNDYEAKLVQEKTGATIEALAAKVKAFIVTRGAEGSLIFAGGQRIEIPCVKAERVLDPTGCGDAYRAGLLYGIANGLPWEETGRLASVMGSVKIAMRGAQNHRLTRAEIGALYADQFGFGLW